MHQTGDQGHIQTLPQRRTYPLILASAVILGHESCNVTSRPYKKAHYGKTQHTGRHGRGYGLGRMPGQKHPVYEMLYRPGACTENEWKGQKQDPAVSAFNTPAIPNYYEKFHHEKLVQAIRYDTNTI